MTMEINGQNIHEWPNPIEIRFENCRIHFDAKELTVSVVGTVSSVIQRRSFYF